MGQQINQPLGYFLLLLIEKLEEAVGYIGTTVKKRQDVLNENTG